MSLYGVRMEIKMKQSPVLRIMTAQPGEIAPDLELFKKRIAADDTELCRLIDRCGVECLKACAPKACYIISDITVIKEETEFGGLLRVKSRGLAKVLDGCGRAVLFGATVGLAIDRIIAKYSAISPARAWICQRIGALYIEAWCDSLCEDIAHNEGLYAKPRFSPGYGDLSIEVQSEISQLLVLPKHCGITLTDNYMMLPTKSVTAFMGLSEAPYCPVNKCSMCNRTECEFRNA